MVRYWLESVRQGMRDFPWTVYPETAGWDLLLVHRDGYQLGIEAKLSLNAKVIEQAIEGSRTYWETSGPDYRAVLVPDGKIQHHMGSICHALGLRVLRAYKDRVHRLADLPDEASNYRNWPNWCPSERCPLPDYIPDVEGGHSAPVQLTLWKVKAIKLMIILERRGYVTRADMKTLQISPTRWCDSWNGMLDRAPDRRAYVRNERTPDYRKVHPRNWEEIEADRADWGKDHETFGDAGCELAGTQKSLPL